MADAEQLAAARAIAQQTYKRFGRKPGSKNYVATSVIGREMKGRGISWVDELIDCYLTYKKQMKAFDAGTALKPDAELLAFWSALLPYITVKMADRPFLGQKKPAKRTGKVTNAALEALAKAEGRKA